LAKVFVTASNRDRSEIYNYIKMTIQQFKSNPIDQWTVQELVVLTETNNKEIFISVLEELLKAQRDSVILPVIVIYGIAVVLDSATEQVDLSGRSGLFNNILRSLKERLNNTPMENNHEELLALLRALSALFKAMICLGIEDIDRENIFNPMKAKLDKLSSSKDLEISFLASYASQSLVYIGNDESKKMSIFRRGRLAIGIVEDIKKIVISFDITRFEAIYNKIKDMNDASIKLGWYQALMFADTLLAEQNFGDFGMFITHNKYNSNTRFMQGACLRLEQLATIYKDQEISTQALNLLKYIESHKSEVVQETARISIKRLEGSYNQYE
jgi:hypothetical protein